MNDDIKEQCNQMAAILGMDHPVSEDVLRAAVADSTYAHNLLVCRETPEYLNHLLSNPPRTRVDDDDVNLGTVVLVRRAAESLLVWARTGFSTVSDTIYQRRLAACRKCPHLQSVPESHRALYKLAGASSKEASVCNQCGCVVTVKARRTSETCPVSHPEHEGINRWGEPFLSGS